MTRTLMIASVLASLAACKPPPPTEPPAKPEADEVEAEVAETAIEETFTFEMGVAWNKHHKFGADGKRLYSQVTLLLYEGGKARVEDGGKLKLSHLDNTYGYESETTEWSNAWMGTWVLRDDALILELELFGRGCKKVIAGLEGTPEEEEECEKASKKVELECRSEAITLDPVLIDLASEKPDSKAYESEQVVDAWVCHPTGDDDELGGTPQAWIFGKGACIEGSSGPYGSRSYGPCRDDDPI
jgi:hypothetical protein